MWQQQCEGYSWTNATEPFSTCSPGGRYRAGNSSNNNLLYLAFCPRTPPGSHTRISSGDDILLSGNNARDTSGRRASAALNSVVSQAELVFRHRKVWWATINK